MKAVATNRWTTLSLFLAASLALVSCGDDSSPSEDEGDTGGSADVGVDTGADTTTGVDVRSKDGGAETGGDTSDGTSDDGGSDGGSELALVVSTVDYKNGKAKVAATVGSSRTPADVKTYDSGDLVLDSSGGRLFALDRRCSGSGEQESCPEDAGAVYELTVGADGSLGVAETYRLPTDVYNPLGAGVATASGRLFVTSYFSSSVYSYESAGQPTSSFDVGRFNVDETQSDPDPEAADVAVEGNYVYVVLLRLNGFKAKNNSVLVGYDASSDALLDMNPGTNTTEALDLEGSNAFAGLDRTPSGGWTVATTGPYRDEEMNFSLEGRIKVLNAEGDGRLSVGDTLVDESTLDGNITAYRMVGDGRGFAIVRKGQSARTVAFDASGGSTSIQEITKGGSTLCTDPDHDEVWVGTTGASGAVLTGYDAATGDPLSGSPVEVEFSPSACRFVETGS